MPCSAPLLTFLSGFREVYTACQHHNNGRDASPERWSYSMCAFVVLALSLCVCLGNVTHVHHTFLSGQPTFFRSFSLPPGAEGGRRRAESTLTGGRIPWVFEVHKLMPH